jgi:hypothetical protein
VAALIQQDSGAQVELVEGGRGEFTVWVGDRQVAAKDRNGFPAETAVVAAVRDALARRP